jgi:Flp pilus assembly protein TadD
MRWTVALLVLATALEAKPVDSSEAESHARRSYQLAQQGLLSEAEGELRKAIDLVPENALYHSALAGLLLKRDKLDEAESELDRSLALNPPAQALPVISARLKQVDLDLGAQLGKTGHNREGLLLAESAAARFPSDARVLEMLGYFQSKGQLNREAAESFARALAIDPSSASASVHLGAALFASGREDEAVRRLESGIIQFPSDPAHYEALAVVLLRMSETGRTTKERARTLFDKALSLDGSLPEAHYELGLLSLEDRRFEAAKEHLLSAERSAPNDSRVHFALARLYRMENRKDDAEREMQAFEAAKAAAPR